MGLADSDVQGLLQKAANRSLLHDLVRLLVAVCFVF